MVVPHDVQRGARVRVPSRDASIVNGVVGEADLWLNGREVAGHNTLQGAYTQYVYDVSGLLRHGANALAFRLYPNDPNTMFTLDNVDWTQIPPDNNTGIQFPVQLHTSAALAISDAHVVEHNAPRVTSSALTLRAQVTNTDRAPGRRGSSPRRSPRPPGPRIRVTQPVTLAPARRADDLARPRRRSTICASTTRTCGGRIRWGPSPSTA